MRFLQSILQDARRPLATGATRIQRSPEKAGAGESPAPPLEEAEDGAMTLYRFQKEGATNPQKVAKPQPTSATPGVEGPGLPSGPSGSRPMGSLAFAELQLDDNGPRDFAVSGNDHVLKAQTESFSSTDVSEPAVSAHASRTHHYLSQKLSETNQVPDLLDPSAERDSESAYGRELNKSRRRDTGAATPSENPHPTMAYAEYAPVPDSAGRPTPARMALSGARPAQPSLEDADTDRTARPAKQTEPTPIPGREGTFAQPGAVQPVVVESEPGREASPDRDPGPRVTIGQLEVMVVNAPKAERPSKTTPSRHFLSRNYLRRL